MIKITIDNGEHAMRISAEWNERFGKFTGLLDDNPQIMAGGDTLGGVIDDLCAKEAEPLAALPSDH